MVINRVLLETAIPFPKSLPHDWWMAYQASFFNSLVWIDDCLINYRLHKNNTIGVGSINKKNDPLAYFLKKLKKLDPRIILKSKIIEAINSYARLSNMMKFEVLNKGYASTELNYLRRWVSYTFDSNHNFKIPQEILNSRRYWNTKLIRVPLKIRQLKFKIYLNCFFKYVIILFVIIFLGKLF